MDFEKDRKISATTNFGISSKDTYIGLSLVSVFAIFALFITQRPIHTYSRQLPPVQEATLQAVAPLPAIVEQTTPPNTPIAVAAPVQQPAPIVHDITKAQGTSLSRVVRQYHLPYHIVKEILSADTSGERPLSILRQHRPIALTLDNNEVKELRYESNDEHQVTVTINDDHAHIVKRDLPFNAHLKYASGVIHDSLYTAGKRAGLSEHMIGQLVEAFNWNFDFAQDLQPGDRFSVIYQKDPAGHSKRGDNNILAASFVNAGKTYSVVRYTDPKGHTDFYTPQGKSVRTAFLRTPVHYDHISSPFTLHRYHPVLHRMRAHVGVDYAAPYGTPIRAAGEGKVAWLGSKGGYGKTIILDHSHQITTLYGHMSAYNRHLSVGEYVKQGEIIGYVGATGLATGPHLHYEFRVREKHLNPQTVKLPQAKPIPHRYRARFVEHAKLLLSQLAMHTRNFRHHFSSSST